jgi:hypothetical protein
MPTDENEKDNVHGSTKFFSWLTEEQCEAKQVKLCAPQMSAAVSSLMPAPIGMRVRALGRYLKSNNVDPSTFGKNQAKTLQELSAELTTGESSLMRSPQGRVIRLVDVVLLKITQADTGSMLVVTKECGAANAGVDVALNRLPGSKRRPDENPFLAAKRVLERQIKISEDDVRLDAGMVQIVEENKDSPSYPGLRTVYVKRIITAELDFTSENLLEPLKSANKDFAPKAAPPGLSGVPEGPSPEGAAGIGFIYALGSSPQPPKPPQYDSAGPGGEESTSPTPPHETITEETEEPSASICRDDPQMNAESRSGSKFSRFRIWRRRELSR